MPRRREMLPRNDPALAPPVDLDDRVELASVDSFPASDPPGWICDAPAIVAKPARPRRPGRGK